MLVKMASNGLLFAIPSSAGLHGETQMRQRSTNKSGTSNGIDEAQLDS